MPETVSRFIEVLPGAIDGWKKTGPPRLFTPENLSDHIDGGAELYISYNFRSALSAKYADPAENEIAVDIFDMGGSHDAFGVFAHTRETIAAELGQGSEYGGGLLTFWKDRYYVSILAYPETPEAKSAVFKLGRAIDGAIANEGPLPPILALLPGEGRIPESVRFFHHYIWLNGFHFVSNENVLDIAGDTPSALAKYRRAGETMFLLLVLYPGPERAEAAAVRFRKELLGGAQDGMARLKDGRWTGIERRGNRIAAVFSAPDAASLGTLLTGIKE